MPSEEIIVNVLLFATPVATFFCSKCLFKTKSRVAPALFAVAMFFSVSGVLLSWIMRDGFNLDSPDSKGALAWSRFLSTLTAVIPIALFLVAIPLLIGIIVIHSEKRRL